MIIVSLNYRCSQSVALRAAMFASSMSLLEMKIHELYPTHQSLVTPMHSNVWEPLLYTTTYAFCPDSLFPLTLSNLSVFNFSSISGNMIQKPSHNWINIFSTHGSMHSNLRVPAQSFSSPPPLLPVEGSILIKSRIWGNSLTTCWRVLICMEAGLAGVRILFFLEIHLSLLCFPFY